MLSSTAKLLSPSRLFGSASRTSRGVSSSSSSIAAAASSAASGMAVTLNVKEVAKNCPLLPRSGACAAPRPPGHAAGAAIMLCGYVERPDDKAARFATNEAWVFEPGANGGEGSWSLVPYADGPAPGPRIASQAVLVGDDVVLIGGWDPSQQGAAAFLDDVWALSTRDWAWRRLPASGSPLFGGGVSRHQAVAVGGGRVLIHTHRCDDHVLELDVASGALKKVAVKGPAPAARGLHSLTRVGGDALLLFGGAPQSGAMMDDLWRLDLKTYEWRRLAPKGAPPHVRCSHVAADAGAGRLLVVGGAFYGASGGLEMLGDAFVYDGASDEWRPAAPGGSGGALPSPRNAAIGVPLPGGGGGLQLLIHGGWRAFVESYADTHIVSIAE